MPGSADPEPPSFEQGQPALATIPPPALIGRVRRLAAAWSHSALSVWTPPDSAGSRVFIPHCSRTIPPRMSRQGLITHVCETTEAHLQESRLHVTSKKVSEQSRSVVSQGEPGPLPEQCHPALMASPPFPSPPSVLEVSGLCTLSKSRGRSFRLLFPFMDLGWSGVMYWDRSPFGTGPRSTTPTPTPTSRTAREVHRTRNVRDPNQDRL